MSKELEAFSRMSDMLSEYEDFICELPYCPDWETEYDWRDEHTVCEALKEKEKQDKKLSELKGIEDKLGCPLEVMFKLVEQNELYYQFYDELQHWDSIKVDLRKKRVWFCKQVGGHYACYQPLSNYGKTFWLKQNKEE